MQYEAVFQQPFYSFWAIRSSNDNDCNLWKMSIFELATESHPLMLKELERMVDECRSMIQDIEIELLTQSLTDEDEHLRYVQLDALVFLIKALRARIKERSFLYN